MNNKNVISLLLLIVSCFSAVGVTPPLKGLWLSGGYKGTDSSTCMNDAAYNLYKSLGYNVVFEPITVPENSIWNTSSITNWSCTDPGRSNLVSYVKDQKAKLDSIGLSYCPYYSDWGWSSGSYKINKRALASVYREVDFSNGYNTDFYTSITKTTDKWCAPETPVPPDPVWNGTDDVVITVNYPVFANAANLNTIVGPSSIKSGQCYSFQTEISFPADANILVGDRLDIVILREFATGQKMPKPMLNIFRWIILKLN